MEEKQVIISIRGRQSGEDLPPDVTELTTEGTMTWEDDRLLLSYQESELTGMTGTTTLVHVQGDTVVLERRGEVCSQMVFQPGKPHSSLYQTPWGAMTIDIVTSHLAHRLSERGGLLEIRYTLSVGQQMISRNQIKIHVREKMR